ncbi:hypothetical protein MSAN_02198100 [Mycena sanguinolenta]|uniref:F-box domain-containing protein n=1 Tax=Mycena sanguinolenta TaxID=230812 RepID=A0A8H7CJY9_9AGAR|nr:hypothetical protein MSAN_02198100 [Mycena sanguinolenta]
MEREQRVTYSYGPFSGVLPHPAERAQLHTVLRSNGPGLIDYRLQAASIEERVAEYDQEIGKVQSLLNKMVTDRTILQKYAVACLGVSGPIQRLLDDILLRIFGFSCAFQPARMTYQARFDVLDHSLLRSLAQVCTDWRSLIMDSPALWAKIGMGSFGLFLDRRMIPFASLALERSGTAPLHICICTHGSGFGSGLFSSLRSSILPPEFTQNPGPSILELFAQHSHRWKKAMISIGESGQAVAQGLTLVENFPLLETLHIAALPDECDRFESAPALTDITLEHPIPPNPKLPWRQLRSFTYAGLRRVTDVTKVKSQLSLCPQITTLWFHNVFLESPRPYTTPPPPLPAIVSDSHTLGISIFPDVEACHGESHGFIALLGCITLRRAHTLVLQAEHDEPFLWSQSAFLAFSARSALHTTLRALEISDVMICAEQLLECLSGLPSLESLSISDPCPTSYNYIDGYGYNSALAMFPVNDTLLRGLTWTPGSHPLVPQLHSFACKTFMQFEESNYLDFVRSRVAPERNADGPFQSSVLYYLHATVSPILTEGLSKLALQKVLISRLERDYLGTAWPQSSKLDPNDLSAPIKGRLDCDSAASYSDGEY